MVGGWIAVTPGSGWGGLAGEAAWAGESQHVSVFEAESALRFIASSGFWCAGDSHLCG